MSAVVEICKRCGHICHSLSRICDDCETWYITFEVYDKLAGDGGTVQDTATRAVQQHNSWQSVTYKGKRYHLHGGIRTSYRIYLHSPLGGRPVRK